MRSLNFAKSKNSKPRLDRFIHHLLDGYQESDRDKTHLHASDVTKSGKDLFCPRELHLLKHLDKNVGDKRYIDTPTRITFDDGWNKQDMLTNHYLKDYVWGNWFCESCHNLEKGRKFPRDYGCGLSMKQDVWCNWKYKEIRLTDPVSGITGSIDMFVDIGTGKYTMVECKIMSPTQFEKLDAPLAEHRLRTKLYLHLIKENSDDRFNSDWAYVLYCSRAHGKKSQELGVISPFKCFTVSEDKESIQTYLNKAHLFNTVKNTNKFACGVCTSIDSNRASKCSVKEECFSGNYPPQVTWEDSSGEPVHEGKTVLTAQ